MKTKTTAKGEMTGRRAAIYARLSRQADKSGSIEDQRELGGKLAKGQGYSVTACIQDADYPSMSYPSGFEDVAKHDIGWRDFFADQRGAKPFRPGLGELFRLVAARAIDVVICTNTDRLWRSAPGSSLHVWAASFLASHGVVIHSVQEGLVQDDFATSLVQGLMAQIKGQDVQKKRERIIQALKSNKDKGLVFVRVHQYGFTSKDGLIPIPEELAVVKRIFAEFLGGKARAGIAQGLNRDGVRTKEKSKTGWTHGHIDRMLSLPYYCGKTRDSAGNLIDSPDYSPHAIVSFGDWLHAQKMRDAAHKAPSHRTNEVLPLSGLVKCGKCGLAMQVMTSKTAWGSSTGKDRRYACRATGKLHDLIRVSGSWGGRYSGLLDILQPLTAEPLLRRLRDAASDDKLVTEREALARRNDDLKAFVDKVLDKARTGIITEDAADRQLASAGKERMDNETQIAAIDKRLAEAETKGIDRAVVAAALTGALKPHVTKELLADAVRSVTVHPDRIVVQMADKAEWSLPRYRTHNVNGLPRVAVGIEGNGENIGAKSMVRVTYIADGLDVSALDMGSVTADTLYLSDVLGVRFVRPA